MGDALGELAGLMPGRYAKFEESSGFIGSLDSYAYRSPAAARLRLVETVPEQPATVPGDAAPAPAEEPAP